jgi:hypothetical protein
MVQMKNILSLAALLISVPAFAGDFTTESAGAPPSEGVAPAILEMVAQDGVAVKDPDGKTAMELWMRTTPWGEEGTDAFGVRFDTIPEGAFMGLIRFPDSASDYREQFVPAGVYTLRFTLHPENGDHMGVAASRDFGILSPAANDTEPATAITDFDALVDMSYEIGNPHATVHRIELPEGDEAPHLWVNDYEHWILDLKVAEEVVGMVVYGHSEE